MPEKCDNLSGKNLPSLDDVLDHSPAGEFFMDCDDIDRDYRRLCKKKGVDQQGENPELRTEAEEKARSRAMKSYEDAISEINHLFSDEDRIKVYREIYVDDVKDFIDSLSKYGKTMYRGKMTGVGSYWAWDKDHAFAYGHSGSSGTPIVLVSTVGCDDLDLEMMIGDYMMFSSDASVMGEPENEVNLLDVRRIVIEEILTRDDENLIEGRTIPAWT